jgi:hypothetical protein
MLIALPCDFHSLLSPSFFTISSARFTFSLSATILPL